MMEGLYSGLIGVIVGGVLTYILSIPYQRKTLYISSITNFRAEWTKEIKVFIADYLAFIQCYNGLSCPCEKINLKIEIIQRMELIKLNLNPIKDEWNEEYIQRMESLYQKYIENNPPTYDSIMLEEFKELSLRLVKIEWDGIKLEAEKGTLNKHQKNQIRRRWSK